MYTEKCRTLDSMLLTLALLALLLLVNSLVWSTSPILWEEPAIRDALPLVAGIASGAALCYLPYVPGRLITFAYLSLCIVSLIG